MYYIKQNNNTLKYFSEQYNELKIKLNKNYKQIYLENFTTFKISGNMFVFNNFFNIMGHKFLFLYGFFPPLILKEYYDDNLQENLTEKTMFNEKSIGRENLKL